MGHVQMNKKKTSKDTNKNLEKNRKIKLFQLKNLNKIRKHKVCIILIYGKQRK